MDRSPVHDLVEPELNLVVLLREVFIGPYGVGRWKSIDNSRLDRRIRKRSARRARRTDRSFGTAAAQQAGSNEKGDKDNALSGHDILLIVGQSVFAIPSGGWVELNSNSGSADSLPLVQILEQRDVEWGRCVQEDVVDVIFPAVLLVGVEEPPHFLLIGLLNVERLGHKLLGCFKVFENCVPAESKAPLHRIKNLHDNHFVFLVSKVSKGAHDFRGPIE